MRKMGAAIAGVALLGGILLAGCTTAYPSQHERVEPSAADCSALLDTVIERIRIGDTAGEINSEMEALSANCGDEFDIAASYSSLLTSAEILGPGSCAEWWERDFPVEAIELLAEDGLCTDGSARGGGIEWPNDGLGWDEAHAHVGTVQRVCGPLMSYRETYDGVFINIGEDYPSPGRFTFIIWGDWWLDPIDPSATICATGLIYLYEGVTQMELGAPQEFEIWL